MFSTLMSMSLELLEFWGLSRKASGQLLSLGPGLPGKASESEGRCACGLGLTGNTESVSESELPLRGEQFLDDRAAFRFSAGKQNKRIEIWSIIHSLNGMRQNVCFWKSLYKFIQQGDDLLITTRQCI